MEDSRPKSKSSKTNPRWRQKLTSNDRLVNGNTQMDERKQNVQCNSELKKIQK